VGAAIVSGEVDFVIFFWDPMEPHPHDVDVKALLRIAVVYNIPIACTRSSADFMLSSPLMEEPYLRALVDYRQRVQRIATVVIETPAGSGIAYEVNECSRRLGVRTVAAGGHTFPVNAGYVPGTLDPRRGPLGVMVLVPDPIPAGATIRARVVGVVRLRNGRGEAPRLLMVPSETVDPASSGIRSVSGIDPLELEKVEAFFTANGYSFEGFGDDLEGRVLLDRARRAADGDPDAACVPW
jgi:inorganic pyrophosphatase